MEHPQPKIPWANLLIACSLLLLFFLFPPFLQNGLILGHDTFLHAAYIHAFTNALSQGQFPVRVIDWFFPGATIPLFNFYPPGFFYYLALLKLTGFSYSGALNTGLLLAWIGSGIGMFLFVKERFHHTLAGLLSGLLFVFAPYHIVDIFVRMALPEFMALTIIPLWFWTTTKFANSGKIQWLLGSACTIALLLLMHLPTAAMFAPIILAYACFLAWEKKSSALLWKLIGSGLLGMFLVAFFLLPAFTEQQFIHSEMAITNKLYDFHNHFVCLNQFFTPSWGYGLSVPGCNDSMPFQIGVVHWVSLLVSIMVIVYTTFISGTNKKRNDLFLGIIFLFFFIVSLVMGMRLSLPLWEHAPYVHFILYPWRFLSVGIFTASFLAGYGLSLTKKLPALILYGLCIYGIFYWYIPYLHANIAATTEAGFNNPGYLTNDKQYQQALFGPDEMFFPKTAKKYPYPGQLPVSQAQVLKGSGTITQQYTVATQKTYKVSLLTPSVVRIFVYYFPGWKIFTDTSITPVNYANQYGYMDVHVPQGNHTLSAVFTDTPARLVGNGVSLVAFLTLLLLFIINFRRTKKSER